MGAECMPERLSDQNQDARGGMNLGRCGIPDAGEAKRMDVPLGKIEG
jgi:hypothetical protein